jgi:hypothetical protein
MCCESGSRAEYGGHSLLQGRAHCSTTNKTKIPRHISVQIGRYHSVCPLVGIGTPPLPPASGQGPHPHPPPPGTKGGAHSPAGEGLGEFQFRRLEKRPSTPLGTPTKRQVSKPQVSKRLVSKRLKRQVYKTSALQNVRFTKCQVYKTSGLHNIRLQKNIHIYSVLVVGGNPQVLLQPCLQAK